MSSPPRSSNDGPAQSGGDPHSPTYAAFSPATVGHYSALNKQRSTILVHQKSPLLVATPPQVTRALAYSHPFLLPLNKLAGLLSWTTGDPWESFLLVAVFWATTLYGDVIVRWAGPIVLVVCLILGMYGRRYSPLSSTANTGEKVEKGHKRGNSEAGTRHHKSLDEIVDELKLFTSRCNILLDPFVRLTDFLSTQQTATSATTRPALTTLFIRILLITPVWVLLTLPPLYIITTRRVILTLGTLALSWHSRPARVSRTILWRSRFVRRITSNITGLDLGAQDPTGSPDPPPLPPRPRDANAIAASLTTKRTPESPGIRFTFTLYENQRRWLGIGWTSSMLAYERASWTDEHLNPAPSKDQFQLPDVEGGHARWRWVEGSEWRVDGGGDNNDSDGGWIYYDNKWRDGRRGQDGWGRYTRRRKWYRDAELVEVTPSAEITPAPTPKPVSAGDEALSEADTAHTDGPPPEYTESVEDDQDTNSTKARKRRWFRRTSKPTSEKSGTAGSVASVSLSARDDEEDVHTPFRFRERESDWGMGDEARMDLG
ncbi:hypothetical protein H2201_006176 [Coniosporium apollinis]|uniref:Peroxin/Ferlin domain-containing protein n=2 Tax=Coniosporium TaxID=2810619 RepID=A0ABQ9NQ02_9PEZI|nr:hypothetical protein H2199_000294 [Cladosporium sp. JES 115]KAJ9662246.1 hypothetical protein H2201_006176 [Coniosporium apollinis]